MNIETLPALNRLSFDIDEKIVPLDSPSRVTHMLRLRLIVRQWLGLADKEAARIVESLGELKIRNGKPVIEPWTIIKSRWANWMAGKPPMRLWTLGATVAGLEFFALERTALYMAHNLGGDDPRVRSLALAVDELSKFRSDPELNGWIWKYRWAIFRRLEKDAKRDKTAATQLSRWSALLASVQEREKQEDAGGKS